MMRMEQDVRNEFQNVETKLEKINVHCKNTDTKCDNIILLLSGNPMDKKDHGIVGDVRSQEERLTKLEKLKDKIFWMVVGGCTLGGTGIGAWIATLTKDLK